MVELENDSINFNKQTTLRRYYRLSTRGGDVNEFNFEIILALRKLFPILATVIYNMGFGWIKKKITSDVTYNYISASNLIFLLSLLSTDEIIKNKNT